MIRDVTLSFVATVLLSGVAAADQPSFVTDGNINVCTTAAFPPLTYKADPADARPVGVDIDIIEALADLWDAEVDYTITDFAGLLPTLGSGRCDAIISGIYINETRREVYDGARYMRSATVIVTRADDETVKIPEDLSGKTLALEAGTYYREERVDPLNKQLSEADSDAVTVQDYPTQQAAYQQVLVGRADATLTEEAEAVFRVASSDNGLRIAYTWQSDFTYGIYVRRNADDFAALKGGLKQLRADGLFEKLAAKYNLDPSVFDVDYDS